MPNKVKYNPDGTENAIFKGNWAIDTSAPNTGGGPSSITGFYNGAEVPEGGYVIYEEGAVRTIADDTELINYTNSKSGEIEITTVAEALDWVADQSNSMAIDKEVENIVTDGLVLNLDPGNVSSYPKSGTTIYDLSGNNYDGTLINGPTYTSENGGVLSFDGSNDRVELSNTQYWKDNVFGNATNFTIMCWTKCNSFYNWSSMIHKDNGGYYSQSEGASLWVNVSGFQAVFGNGISGNSGAWGNIISYSTNDTSNWYHLAFTGNGSTLRFYVNGNLHASQGQSQRTAGKNITDTPVRFGVRGNYAHYNGKISGSLLYDRELSSTEVLQNYNAQKGRFGL